MSCWCMEHKHVGIFTMFAGGGAERWPGDFPLLPYICDLFHLFVAKGDDNE